MVATGRRLRFQAIRGAFRFPDLCAVPVLAHARVELQPDDLADDTGRLLEEQPVAWIENLSGDADGGGCQCLLCSFCLSGTDRCGAQHVFFSFYPRGITPLAYS